MARESKTQPTVNGSPVMVTVNHGATAGTARPIGAVTVMWVGSVTPTNALDGDLWVDTT